MCRIHRHWLRFRMPHSIARMARNFRGCGPPRRRSNVVAIIVASVILMFIILYGFSASHFPREEKMEKNIADLQTRLQFLESLYRARSEDILKIQNKLFARNNFTYARIKINATNNDKHSPEVMMMLKNMTGMKAGSGVHTKALSTMQSSFIFKLLPHLMDDPNSLRPAYHLRSSRYHSKVVIGIPTVKRDKQSYLIVTLGHLIGRLTEKDENDTLIVIFIGETDLEYVLSLAKQIETEFQNAVEHGIIEIISPSAAYYPDFDEIPLSLGDSFKRVKWRSKQNLDTIYLMAYAQTRGTYYLMLEDDVIAQDNYMQEIKQFVSTMSISTPDWFILEFCHVGGIGKLFRSSDLINFIVYVQLFYKNMPIDWLIESYLADRVCTIDKSSHIGLYSSLKGKIQKVKDPRYGTLPLYYPHNNPPIKFVRVTIKEKGEHTIQSAYEGKTYFWGISPKKGEVIEFWFAKPTRISSYTFRSGNIAHQSDKFHDTIVEILTENSEKFFIIDRFDEFGLADGKLDYNLGPLLAIRMRVLKDSFYWVVLSEIELKTNFNHRRSPRQSNRMNKSWNAFPKSLQKPYKKALRKH